MTQSSADIGHLLERGSILIGLIVTMVVMAILGGGMLYLTTTSEFNELYYGSHSDAYYAAEAGGRYAKAVIRDAYANDKTKMNAINANQTFTLANGSRFQITSVVESVSGNTATVTFSSTGMVGTGLLTARRQINYSIQPANQTAGGSGQTISEPNMDNFVASTQGQFTKADGALTVAGVSQDAYADEKRAFAYYKNSSVDFSAYRTAQSGYLSYDAQVKVKSTTNYFLAGLGFRTHPLRNQTSGTTSTDPRSLHISFLRFSDNDNTDSTSSIDKIPLELKYQNWTSYGSGGVSGPLEIGSYYVVLWMDYGPNGDIDSTVAMERLLAYKKIDSTSGVFTQTIQFPLDDMESGTNGWTVSNLGGTIAYPWSLNDYTSTPSNYNSATHSWRTLITEQNRSSSLISKQINAASMTSGTLSFYYKMPSLRRSSVSVQICTGAGGTSCSDLGFSATIDNSWHSVQIPVTGLTATTFIKFIAQTNNTTSTKSVEWFIDDVKVEGATTFTPWSTLLVRLEEKLLTASDYTNANFSVGTRVNKIVAYYSTPTSNGTGNHPGGAIDANRTGSNPLGTFNWPAASGASDMNFTLVKWDWVRDDSNTTSNSTVIGNYPVKTIVETKYYRTTGKDSDNLGGYTVTAEYDDLGLSIFGVYTTNNVFFDDFAVKIGTGSGSDGSGTVIQYP